MSDQEFIGTVYVSHTEKENRLTGERHKDFRGALEDLSIPNNTSGRLKFLGAWPEAARYIFDAQLIEFDCNGVTDKKRRAGLELQAEEKWIKFVQLVETFESRSVEGGTLQVNYVRDVINTLGRDLALLLYAPWIVDKFIPPPPKPEEPAPEAAPEAAKQKPPATDSSLIHEYVETAPVAENEVPHIYKQVMVEDIIEPIKPIAVGQQDSAPPQEIQPVASAPPEEPEEEDKPLFVADSVTEQLAPPPAPPETIPEKPAEEEIRPITTEPQAQPRKLKIFGIKENPPS